MTEADNAIQTAVREAAVRLLSEGRVKMIIGYGQGANGTVNPVFVRDAEQADSLVWNSQCFHNLATYLSRANVKKHFPVGLVVKGCDRRAVNMLLKEYVLAREDVVLIGVPCSGVGDPLLKKCLHCEVRTPADVDERIPGEPQEPGNVDEKLYAEVDKIDAMSPAERWEHWAAHFDRCIRCYACRQVCPMCYCKRCIVEKTEPQWVESSAHRRGNFSWNAIRAFHLTGRCVGCGECERVCPAGIPLSQINSKMTRAVAERFKYQAGMDDHTPTPFTAYDPKIDNDEGIL